MIRMLHAIVPPLVIVLLLIDTRVGLAQFQVPSSRAVGQDSQRRFRSHGDVWIARDQTAGAAVPLLKCETSVPGLEEIREQKRQRIQAIRARIEKLMRSTPSTTPVVRSMTDRQTQSTLSDELLPPKPELPPENPSDQPVPFPQDPGPADSIVPDESPENTPTTDVESNSQSSLVIPEMSPLDGLSPSAKAATPTTGDVSPESVVESPVLESPAVMSETAAPRSPIADMIEALDKPQTTEQPSDSETASVQNPPSLSATTVLNSPVDRLKLADNLFATGEYSLALQMYDAAGSKGSKLGNEDQAWVTYQKAGCYRHLEMMDEAESLYRQAAGDADAEWLAKVARWWLDRIAERETLKQEIGQVKEVLDTFKKAKLDASTNSQ